MFVDAQQFDETAVVRSEASDRGTLIPSESSGLHTTVRHVRLGGISR